jgi:two-component system cell cycle sensor histidine kinase/response regulator CckA
MGGEHPRTILMIEDDEHVRQLAAAVLERDGFQVLQASDAPEAAEIWVRNSQTISLVLTDIVMPGWSGPEIAQELRTSRPGLKVIFTSGYDQQSVADQMKSVKGAKFISKPYSVKALLELVRGCFNPH